MPLNGSVLGPLQDRHAGQLGAVIADNGLWFSSFVDNPAKIPGNAGAG
jgi:hypothetical protein